MTDDVTTQNMINIGIDVGFTSASVIGLVQILGALGYFALSIGQVVAVARSANASGIPIAIRVLQGILGPLILLVSGGILFFQGWRLDPILAFQTFLMTVLIAYLVVLDLRR